MRIMGVDPSLTATGVCILDTDGPSARMWTFGEKGHRGATLAETSERLLRLREEVLSVESMYEPSLIVIESPSYGSKHGSRSERDGLWWLLTAALSRRAPMTSVTPAERARFACGKAGPTATKSAVMAAVAHHWPWATAANHNEADALVLAIIAAVDAGEMEAPTTFPAAA